MGPLKLNRVWGNIRARLYRPARTAEPEEAIEAGDFRIDLRGRNAQLRGQTLHLTAAEFDLLVFLIRHPKKIISAHTQLVTRWGGTQVRQTEFLRVLRELGKKLEGNSSSPRYIRTEPWICYRFNPGK
jgi:two-component system KDP operon response regulator KdpE